MRTIGSPGRFSPFRLLRVLRFGLARRRNRAPLPAPLRALETLRRKHDELGFTAPVQTELAAVAATSRNPAQRALARLYLARMALEETDPPTVIDPRPTLAEAAHAIAAAGQGGIQGGALPPAMQPALRVLAVALAQRLAPDPAPGSAEARVHEMAARILAQGPAPLGQGDTGRTTEGAKRASDTTPEALLLCTARAPTPKARLHWLNRALEAQGLPPLRLDPQGAVPARAGLRPAPGAKGHAVPPAAPGHIPPQAADPAAPESSASASGPTPSTAAPSIPAPASIPVLARRRLARVSVMIVLGRPEDSLPAAPGAGLLLSLRGLLDQHHRPDEILLLDASGAPLPPLDGLAHPLRVLSLPPGTGVLAAATRGLAAARGQAVALLRAGDLPLPHWLARAAQALAADPARLGVLPTRAVLDAELRIPLPPGADSPAPPDPFSALLRRRPLRQGFGGWADLPLGAPEDLLARIRASCGDLAIHPLAGGPDLLGDTPATALPEAALPDPALHPALLRQVQDAAPGALARARPQTLPLPLRAPALAATPSAPAPTPTAHFDVILASDFRLRGGSNMSNAQELACQRAHGLRTGVLPMYRYDFDQIDRPLQPEIRAEIDGERVVLLGSGMEAACDLLVIRYPSVLWYPQRFLPRIRARAIRVIINQPPMSDYGFDARRRYHLADCARVLRAQFGPGAVWHPIGPLVRDALHRHHGAELAHITLSDQDWHNIIDLSGWEVPAAPAPHP
ncbi:hypothetical protein HUK65_14605, partial [Rhodobacteraceae bacterium 2376]